MVDRQLLDVGNAVPCARCGYDLRGKALGDACPECNSPVAAAMDPVSFALSDSQWVSTLAKGSASWRIFAWPAVVMPVVALTIAAVASAMNPVVAVAVGVFTVGGLLAVAPLRGVWLVTTLPTIRLFSPRIRACRAIARACMPIVFLIGPVLCALMEWRFAGSRWATYSLWIFTPFGLVGTIGGVAFLLYFRRLAEVMGVVGAVREARVHSIVLPLGFAATAMGHLAPSTWGREWPVALVACGLLAQVSAGILALLMPVTIAKRAAALREAATIESRG